MANVNQRWILFFNFSRSCADLAETTAHHKLIDQKYGVYFIPNWKFDSFSSVKLYLQGLALSWSIVSCWPDPTNRNYSGQNRSNFRKKNYHCCQKASAKRVEKNFLKILQDINLERVKLLGQNLHILGCIQFGFHIKKLVVIKTIYKTRASCKRTYFQG